MFVKSQDGAVVLNNDKVTEYSTDSKYDGRYSILTARHPDMTETM